MKLYYYKNKIKFFPSILFKKGQGVVEYAFIIAFVVVVAVGFAAGTNPVSEQVLNIFTDLSALISKATS